MNFLAKSLFIIFFLALEGVKVFANENEIKNSNTIDTTKIKISLPQDIKEQNIETTKKIKIDETTDAKITISTRTDAEQENKKNDKQNTKVIDVKTINDDNKNNIKTQTEQKKNDTTNTSQNDSKQTTTQIANNNTSSQNITINGTYDFNKTNSITIRDGVKNINITFVPNIAVNCGNEKCKKQTTNIKKTNNKKKAKQQIQKKRKVNTIAKTRKTQHTNKQEQTQPIIIHNRSFENISREQNIRKSETIQQVMPPQNIYVINKIINLDENTELTSDIIGKLTSDEIDTEKLKNIVIENNKKSVTSSSSLYRQNNNKFKQRYDLIEANHVSYGEVAFVEDYNN